MSAPRTPGIYIGMMTLVTFCLLAWSSIAAPCIEIGFFWVSAASALAVSIFAWLNGDRIGQGGMLLVCFMLACSIALAVTSIADNANFSILGEKYDAETGLLLGGLLAFCVVAAISARLSRKYPSTLAWGASLACTIAWAIWNYSLNRLLPEYTFIVTLIYTAGGLAAFLALCSCRDNLKDSQYIAVLAAIIVHLVISLPGSDENIPAGLIMSFFMSLAGILFLSVRSKAHTTVQITNLMFLYFGLESLAHNILNHIAGVQDIPAGIFISLAIMVWIWLRRDSIAGGFYRVSQFTFAVLGVCCLVPEAYSDQLFLGLVSALLLYTIACIRYALSVFPEWQLSLGDSSRYALAACGVLFVLVVTSAWCAAAIHMLKRNLGPARMVLYLKDTPLWPGDKAYVRLFMSDESLWPESVRNNPATDSELKEYIKYIRPGADRFSSITGTEEMEDDDEGYNDAGIGVKWRLVKNHLALLQVNAKSSAGYAGLFRGDRVLAVNGRKIDGMRKDDHDAWDRLFCKWQKGAVLSLDVRTHDGMKRNVALKIGDDYEDPPKSRIITAAKGRKVGYLYLHSFNDYQFREIRSHFRHFKDVGVQDLVIDLRYNSGGIMDYASQLAGLIGGETFEGRAFAAARHSERYQDRNDQYVFAKLPESLGIRKLAVITTRSTCSASELMISGLKPYLPVVTVGSATCGKPYSMSPIKIGEVVLFPVTARVLNSRGEGHYLTGIKPDFKADDDTSHQLGDPEEGMLKKALEVLWY